MLDIDALRRDGQLAPGQTRSGTLTWTGQDGRVLLRADLRAYLDQYGGRLMLAYEREEYWTGQRHQITSTLDLIARAQPSGGHRWWWMCPHTGRHVTKLYLPLGALRFSSRHGYKLAYQSQRETPSDRALRRSFHLRARLGLDGAGEGGAKPKGMRWATYHREMDKLEEAEWIVDGHTVALAQRLAKWRGC